MFKSGNTILGSGVTALAVSFTGSFDATPHSVVATVENVTDANYLLLTPFIIFKAVTGFHVELNGATDSANYKLDWMASDATGPVGNTGATGSTGSAASITSKPINRLPVLSSIASGDYVAVQSTSGGVPVTYRATLGVVKTFIDS